MSPRAPDLAVAALMPLARCLPGHAELRGNLRPADSELNCTVDERVKLRLGPVPLNSNAPDSLQDLSRGALVRCCAALVASTAS